MAEPETYLAVFKAAFDYDPQPDAEDELPVKEGQLLLLLERTDEDWWRVKVKPESQDEDGPSGLVPQAYVQEAEHISIVKALYDYEATQSTELSVNEDDILYVYDKDDAWMLARKESDDSRVGYVPGNYVEEVNDEEPAPAATPAPAAISQIVIPPSPARPVSTYVDPAERVAAASSKAQADDIKTWTISEVDKKGKKKKGTLGVGNGAVFFASESDKTPVQKWQTGDIQGVRPEKSKHVLIDIGGSEPVSLHFHAGSKEVAEAIIAKLESSRSLAAAETSPGPSTLAPPAVEEHEPRRSSPLKVVHFDASEPEIIPPREASDDEGVEDVQPEGEPAVVLYDFSADAEDELSVQEGEALIVLERDGNEWWKCRNSSGAEGVVPAQYVELVNGGAATAAAADQEEEDAAAFEAAREAEERAEEERRAREEERERADRDRKKLEAERRAKAAASAAEADRKRREQERAKQAEEARAAAAVEERKKEKAQEKAREAERRESSRSKKASGDTPNSSRGSIDRRGPPPENTRVWHDKTGQFSVEAAFLGVVNGKLRLHKINGVVIEVPAEKMSGDDMKYVEKFSKKSSPPRKSEDDDQPLELRRRSLQPEAMRAASVSKPKKTTDWFDFFLNAGCDVDDCTRYASAFERDKIDESILPDITESTMRSLGLREGDIIRVKKAIEQRQAKKPDDNAVQEQLRRDEELARQLQAEENGSSGGKPRSQPPNLFAAGPKGELKNSSMRRGRPQPSKSMPPSSVDLGSITTASSQVQRTSSPLVASPESTVPPSSTPVRPPSVAVSSGFDDDAWTNRPSSTKPAAPTPPVTAPTPMAPATPASPAPPAPPPPAPPSVTVQAVAPAASTTPAPAPAPPQSTGPSLAKTDNDLFEQLARLSQLRTQSPAVQAPQRAPSVPLSVSTPISYSSGLGMGSSPVPIGQHLQNQQTGLLAQPQPPLNGPRGPLAPVPANQSLLQPLIPTTTGFNSFVPTRPQSAQSPFQSQPQPPQPSFLSTQPTGFPGANQTLLPQMTGFPGANPLSAQPTGFSGGNFSNAGPLYSQPTGMPNNYGSSVNGAFGSTPPFQSNTGAFGQVQSNPMGYNPGFGQSPFASGVVSPPPAPPSQPSINSTSPANVFAQMKSGTFANEDASGPQGADKYDALRVNPSPLPVQPTGWGYQGMNGTFTGGYGYQH